MIWSRRTDVGPEAAERFRGIPIAAESSTGAPEFAWDEIDGWDDAVGPLNEPSAGGDRMEFPSFGRAAFVGLRLVPMRPPQSWRAANGCSIS